MLFHIFIFLFYFYFIFISGCLEIFPNLWTFSFFNIYFNPFNKHLILLWVLNFLVLIHWFYLSFFPYSFLDFGWKIIFPGTFQLSFINLAWLWCFWADPWIPILALNDRRPYGFFYPTNSKKFPEIIWFTKILDCVNRWFSFPSSSFFFRILINNEMKLPFLLLSRFPVL